MRVRALAGHDLQAELAGALVPVFRAIGASIGPDGRHVLYATGNRVATAASGSEIARWVCSDHFAARLLKETLLAAERDLGDGTARLAVMAGAALSVARRGIAAGAVPEKVITALVALRPALDEAFAAERAEAVDLVAVALAAGAEPALAQRLAEACHAVGAAGLVEVTDGREPGVTLDIRQGFGFQAKSVGSAGLDAMGPCHLIVANEVIRDFRTLAPVIEGFARSDKSLILVVRGLEDQALQLIERNRQAGVLKVVALAPRDMGPRAAEILEDLATATGAVLVSDHSGTTLEALKPAMLGRAQSFRREGALVSLTGGGGDPAQIVARLRLIEAEIAAKRYLPLDREHARQRHARLSGCWAEVRIGTRGHGDEAVAQARRALASIRSARDGGVIDGGGRGLDRVAAHLAARPAASDEAATAQAMVLAALRAPGICLRQNSGPTEPFGTTPVADPAGLSRSLLDVALSLAGRLAGLEGAVIRH